jgi:nicotinamidase-related amidase
MEQQNNTALLVMDIQASILGRLPDAANLLANISKAISHAREKAIPVIYVRVGFRAGMPEVSARNKSFAESKLRMGNVDMEEFMKIHPHVAPKEGEIIVTKRRYSAFTGSDLEVVLKGYDVVNLVLAGISTSGVVLSTLREAADKDFGLTVLADCCADTDDEVHNVLINKVFPRQAEILNVADWNNQLIKRISFVYK